MIVEPIAANPITDGIAVNPVVAFYDIHARKGEMLFLSFAPDITRDL
jgi:hypothetical protein